MEFIRIHPDSIYYNVQDFSIKNSQTYVRISFYWLFQMEYQNIMNMKCIKCLNPEFERNHSTACINCWEVVIDDDIAIQSVKMISTEQLIKATFEIGKLFNLCSNNCSIDLSHFCENIIQNVSPKEMAYAVNYRWSPIFTKLGDL